MGRKTKLNDEIIKIVYDLAKQGLPDGKIADVIGITQECFCRWKKQGEEGKSALHRKFYTEYKKAVGEFIKNNLQLIQKAATDGSWQAAAWLLERRFWDEFGKKEQMKMEHSGKIDISVLKDYLKEK
ncbi:MAG: hypothetical protein H5T45_01565 [Thermoplasmatales archaeon]|nr:hypothetical protein [Thermoplasmatales archaeon]